MKTIENPMRDIGEDFYRSILESTVDGLWIADSKGAIVAVNNALCDILGYNRTELLSLTLYDVDVSKAFEEGIIHIGRIIEKESDRYETRYRTKNGKTIDVEVSVGYHADPESGGRFLGLVRNISERVEIETYRRNEEMKFRLYFEESSDPIVIFESGRCFECNKAALEVLGFSDKTAFIGLGLSEVSPEKQPDGELSVDKAKKLFGEVKQKQGNRFGWLCRNNNGQEYWFDVTCSTIMNGDKILLCTFWRDMTEQKALEDKLRESEDRFRIFNLSGQHAVIIMDEDWKIIYISPMAERVLGYGNDEVTGKDLQEYLILENFYEAQKLQLALAEVLPYLKTTKTTDEPGRALELTVMGKDGRTVSVDLSLFSERIGDKWRIIGILRDVTERKRTLEALQKSEEKYRRLFEETKDVVFLSTPSGRYLDINKSGLELFGYGSKEEIMKVDIGRELYWNSSERQEFLQALERQGFVNMHEIAMKTKDGQKVIVSATANVIYDEEGNISHYQGILRDLTAQKKMEQQLFEYQKLDALGRMIGDIAHNFNNILNIIIGNAQLAKMSGQCTGDASIHLSSIEDEVFRAADIVEQLLAFGRKKQIDVKTVDMNLAVKEFLKLVDEVVGARVQIKTIFASQPVTARIDTGRINQVLLNLVMNARDAMSGEGTITIVIDTAEVSGAQKAYHAGVKPGTYVVVTVSDTGHGISEETMKKIFEPFFTTDTSGEKKGLGLSVVYGIVKQHGGFINAESRGEGSTFKIYLPVSAIEKPHKQIEKSVTGGGETILLAEDEPALRDVASAILKRLGYKVYSAADGMEAVTVFKEKSDEVDMVLLDVAMPVMNGVDAYREMRKTREDLPVLFMTGYSLDGIQTNFIFEEGHEAIHKPYTLNTLGKKIRGVLEKAIVSKEK